MYKISQETLDRINKGLAKESEYKDAIISDLICPKECCLEPKNQKAIEGISFEIAFLCENCNTVTICNLPKLWEHARAFYKRLTDNVHDEVEIEIKKCESDDETNQEYTVITKKEKRCVGYIEYYRTFNDFIFEPIHWIHISKSNLNKITEFINKLEIKKDKKDDINDR